MQPSLVKLSKFLSFVLRHNPASIGLSLDPAGWAQVDELVMAARKAGKPLTQELLRHIVTQNDKQRFSLSTDGQKIRANQGHSLAVDLGLEPLTPPDALFHGTATRFLPSIQKEGLLPGGRLHVHLSPDEQTAIKVGQRHGKPVVLNIQAARMAACGYQFYRSANGVWLTNRVPVEFIMFP
ncbi:probable RNA 2'-phosphotransferase [Candidatus Vecturithrix granuli]|uniref:Probable RNA 2'-phosphotransferase n=1 Tax=Vecturithrix granuli TaxID=1499967 RepID=A0A081BYT6_VECG1|nr:probable RNA 2'-phosphotransferase [Candidatus Vecturithrix granuli]